MGYSAEASKKALHKFDGDISSATNYLVENNEHLDNPIPEETPQSTTSHPVIPPTNPQGK